jgi:hypothetical protein
MGWIFKMGCCFFFFVVVLHIDGIGE